MKFVTIQDYGNYSVIEPYDSASTNSVTSQVLNQTAQREAKNRHIKAEREATLSAITGGMLTVAAAITMILHWIIIGY